MNLILFYDTELSDESSGQAGLPRQAGPDYSQRAQVSAFLHRHDDRTIHLLKILRKKAGDNFDAGILGGKLGTGIIKETSSEGLHIDLVLDTEPPPRTALRLGVGFPRPIQLRRLLRDCASLGLDAVDLIGTELGEKSYRNTKLLDDGGAQAALIEGAIQARDTRLPKLAVYHSLAAWLQMNRAPETVLITADNVQPQGSFAGLLPFQPGTSAVLTVGSERGWSKNERELLEKAGFVRLSLGKRALRTETACTAALILLMEKMGLLE